LPVNARLWGAVRHGTGESKKKKKKKKRAAPPSTSSAVPSEFFIGCCLPGDSRERLGPRWNGTRFELRILRETLIGEREALA